VKPVIIDSQSQALPIR